MKLKAEQRQRAIWSHRLWMRDAHPWGDNSQPDFELLFFNLHMEEVTAIQPFHQRRDVKIMAQAAREVQVTTTTSNEQKDFRPNEELSHAQ